MKNTTNINVPSTSAERTSLERVAGFIGTGFAGLFVIPVLAIFGITFAAVGAGLPILSILNLVGLTHIPFDIVFWQIVGIPQVFVAFIVGAVFLGLGGLSFYGLKKFFSFSRWLTR